ncbi:MAG: SDR family NAD(P)-dependent oxidoreductase [Pseudomonadota bacterium]
MTDLRNATVLITGACGGFGRHMTRQFVEAGARVVPSDMDPAALDALVEQIRNDVPGAALAKPVAVNLAEPEGAQLLFDAVTADGIQVDVLVNNAGIGVFGRHDEVPAQAWEKVMAVNLLAPMRLCGLFVPGMIAKGSGHIVNISSVAGWLGTTGMGSYAASKFGLRGFGDSLAEELHPHSIRVTTVCPFFSKTPILDSERVGSLPDVMPPDWMVTDPAGVVRKVIAGVKRDKRFVFPDPAAKTLHWLKRLAPWLIPPGSRAMLALGARQQQRDMS